MGTANLFVYGTLMSEAIAKKVVGRLPAISAAVLDGHARYRIKGAVYPAIIEKTDERVRGQVRLRCLRVAEERVSDKLSSIVQFQDLNFTSSADAAPKGSYSKRTHQPGRCAPTCSELWEFCGPTLPLYRGEIGQYQDA